MKVWCETCYGEWQIEASGLFENEFKDCIYTCQDCNGKGYTENNDIDYQARVGIATIKAFDKGCWVTNMSGVYYENIEEFIESDGE